MSNEEWSKPEMFARKLGPTKSNESGQKSEVLSITKGYNTNTQLPPGKKEQKNIQKFEESGATMMVVSKKPERKKILTLTPG